MAKRSRSPVLGYNHNLRHGGRVFHVQTEDSGQGYARLYTHLFYEGTILSSKKHEYDPEAPEEAVRAIMQKLHKLMIKELTNAQHDARIAAFFNARGEPAVLEDASGPTAAGGAAPSVPAAVAAAPAPAAVAAPAAVELAAPAPAAVAAAVVVVPAPAPAARPKPMVVVQAPKRPPVVLSDAADGVVVRRNVVIDVGAGQPPVHGTIGPPASPPTRARAGSGYAVRDGAGYATGNRARAPSAAPSVAQSQPLASARDIRMPWETPGPTRIVPVATAPIVAPTAADAPRSATGKIRMPWDPPSPAASEAFVGNLVSDKSLDEVILEYLADDGEPEER